jgi:hypothetical protein
MWHAQWHLPASTPVGLRLRVRRGSGSRRLEEQVPGAGDSLGEPSAGMEPAAGLVKLAARRPARGCLLADRSLLVVPTRYEHRVPCCSLPRGSSTWRLRLWPIPG